MDTHITQENYLPEPKNPVSLYWDFKDKGEEVNADAPETLNVFLQANPDNSDITIVIQAADSSYEPPTSSYFSREETPDGGVTFTWNQPSFTHSSLFHIAHAIYERALDRYSLVNKELISNP